MATYEKKKKIWLSPTGVETMNRCPRCFWLQYKKKIRQPEGIVSRLANRFDGVIKKYFDIYRETGEIPPIVKGKIEGQLENPFVEKYWYHHDDNYGYHGRLDECLVSGGLYTPVDHKTSSSDPRTKDEILPAYQNQLDSYAWLLEENNKKTTGKGYLIFFYPDEDDALHEGFNMVIHVVTLKTTPANAKKKFLKAIKVLEGPLPDPSLECPFCSWKDAVTDHIKKEKGMDEKAEQSKLF